MQCKAKQSKVFTETMCNKINTTNSSLSPSSNNNRNNKTKKVIGKKYGKDVDYTWFNNEEPHRARRLEILSKYPEIKQLYGHEPKTKYIAAFTALIQIYIAIQMKHVESNFVFFLMSYVIGATIHQSLFLCIHEWSHNLGFKHPRHNQIGSVFVNLPIGIPYAALFKPYHMDHHRNQGVHEIDTDISHPIEAAVIQNRLAMKFLYFFFQLLFYAFRPTIIVKPQINALVIGNWAMQLTFNFFMLYLNDWSFRPMAYLLLSTFISGSFHPTAGHFLSEHLEVIEGVETYSYYGVLNKVTYNVGYHNEHHDFPYVAWSKLPEVYEIAKEFYEPLPKCESWVKIIWDYVTNPNLGAYSRVKRMKRVSQYEKINPNDVFGSDTAQRTSLDKTEEDQSKTK